ncbi:MAG: ABC transporter permease [Verrucomicrobiota bacterium]|nr:ABC transporter permease [Verrucomicrobiota bacterium]
MIGDSLQEIRLAARSLAKRPGFSVVAILTLALGIGASTSIFSVVDAVLLRPLPFPQPERIVELRELDEKGHGMAFADPNFDDLRARSHSFEALARYGSGPEAVSGGSEPVRTDVCMASADFFRVLGVTPQFGHLFSPDAVGENREAVVVSAKFWRRYLEGRPSLEGTVLRLENRSFTVAGVLPDGMEFPPGADVWVPAEIYPPVPSRTAHNWRVAGRLNPGVSLDQARAEASAIGHQLKAEHGNETDAVSFSISQLRERLVKDIRGILLVVGGAVALLLLIACSNVANLLLVRATMRRQEMAVRVALGASRWQLTRQCLAETLLLTAAGGALGVVLAIWGVDLIVGAYRGNLPRVGAIGVNLSVLLFTLAISAITGLALGLVAAVASSHRRSQGDLQSGGRGKSAGRSSSRVRSCLVVSQVALTLLLLVGAGLLGRSFQRLMAVDPGFQTESAVAMTLLQGAEPASAQPQRRVAQLYHELIERLQALPGVTAVGGISSLPMSPGGGNGTFIIEDGSKPAETMAALEKQQHALAGTGKTGDAEYRVASAGYFTAMGIPLIHGRFFQESDGPDAPHVVVISESLARRYWPNEDPLGRQIQFGNMDGDLRLLTVVGVVGDVRAERLDEEPRPMVYANYFQRRAAMAQFCIVVRGQGDAAALTSAMRREARALNPDMPAEFRTLREIVSASLDSRRFSMLMLAVFAGAALALAVVGLYGIVSFITAQRTTELGIRMALGAQRGDMLRLVLRQSFTLVALGIGAGLVTAVAATRVLATLLFGVGAADLTTYAGVVCLLLIAGLVATYLPARRAMNVDPMLALRHD